MVPGDVSARGELVTFNNRRGLPLDGVLYRSPGTVTIVHVHGSMGNFYHNLFLRLMACRYNEAGITFLPFNLSTHDCVTEGFRYDYSFDYTGGALVEFGTCVDDIDSAVAFAKAFSQTVILQGHSLGCDRVVEYLIETGTHHDFVLLGPCDSYALQSIWIAPETVEEQVARLKASDDAAAKEGWDWLPRKEYGIRSGDEKYFIPITRPAFLSIAQGPPFRLFRYDRLPAFRMSQRALVYIGGKDAFLTVHPDTVFEYFDHGVSHLTRAYYPEADHDMDGYEEEVVDQIVKWAKQC